MYTRCPGCHTVHPVNAALLSAGGGRYRCGKCNKVSNAVESLFDQWPQAGVQPVPPGEIPVLGLSLDLEGAARSRTAPADAGFDDTEDRIEAPAGARSRWLVRSVWIVGAIVILAVTAWQWTEFLGNPLLERPQVRAALVRLGLLSPPPEKPFRDLAMIHLVSRELSSHPHRSGQLRLSATIVNRATRKQPYPDIEVTLLDASGRALLQQRFAPADYLDPGSAPGASMVPHAYLPLAVDLEDPGPRAVGFELEFR